MSNAEHDPIASHFDTIAIKTIIKRAVPTDQQNQDDDMYERTLVGDQDTESLARWGLEKVSDSDAKKSLRRFLR